MQSAKLPGRNPCVVTVVALVNAEQSEQASPLAGLTLAATFEGGGHGRRGIAVSPELGIMVICGRRAQPVMVYRVGVAVFARGCPRNKPRCWHLGPRTWHAHTYYVRLPHGGSEIRVTHRSLPGPRDGEGSMMQACGVFSHVCACVCVISRN